MDGFVAKFPTLSQCAALLMCFHLGCGSLTDSETEGLDGSSLAPPTLQLVNVSRVVASEKEVRTFVFYGKLTAEESAVLRFSVAGQVDRVEASVGDAKKRGDVLAVIAQPQLTADKAKLDDQLQQLNDSVTGRSPAQRALIQEQISGVQAQQKQLEALLANGVLVAPFDCIVRSVRVSAGKSASPIVAALEVVADRQPIVVGNLPEGTSLPLPSDQPVWVAIAGRTFKCIMRQPDPAEAKVVSEFAEPLAPDYWLFDDVVEARFRLLIDSEGFWLPIGALGRGTDGGWEVLAVEAEAEAEAEDKSDKSDGVVLEARAVNVLRTTFDSVLVDGQVDIGDLIVAAGGHRVVAGQRVVVRPVVGDAVAPTGAGL